MDFVIPHEYSFGVLFKAVHIAYVVGKVIVAINGAAEGYRAQVCEFLPFF